MTDETITDQSDDRSRPVGRILRLILGAVLLGLLYGELTSASSELLTCTSAVFVGLIIFYALVHLLVLKFLPNINKYLGTILALSPAIAVFVLAGAAGQIGVTGFIGGSLILDAITADLGCEVMALPGLFFSQRTHLCCILFSPIDWLEDKFLRF